MVLMSQTLLKNQIYKVLISQWLTTKPYLYCHEKYAMGQWPNDVYITEKVEINPLLEGIIITIRRGHSNLE